MKMEIFYKKFFRKNKSRHTIYQSLSPILKLSAVGGICNLSEHEGKFTPSHCLTVFQVVAILANIVHLIFVPMAIFHSEKKNEELVNQLNQTKYTLNMSDFVTRMANPMLISGSTLVLRITNLILLYKHLPRMYSKLDDAEKIIDFRNLNCKEHDYMKLRMGWTLFLSVPYQTYILFHDRVTKISIIKIIFGLNYYNNFATCCVEYQLTYLSYLLKNRFKILNEYLKEIKNMKEDFNTLIYPRRSDILLNQSNHLSSRTTMQILKIRDCHQKICGCCRELNALYGIHLLIILTSCGINTLLNLYFAFYGGYENPMSEHVTMGIVMQQLCWATYYFTRFVNLCVVSEKLSREADMTNVLICKLLRYCTNNNLRDELWVFYSFATSNVIKFSACGFFTADLSLISSALSVGTTYLVILAQFHGDNK